MTDAFDLSLARVHNSPFSVGNWPITTTLTALEFREKGVYVEFPKKDGPNRWPDVNPKLADGTPWTNPDGSLGMIQYTLWIGMNIGGTWHVSAQMEYWHDLDANGGNVTLDNQIAKNWTYDCDEMARQPAPGEPVAFFVTAGDQRKKDVWAVHERSQVAIVPFPATVPQTFTFSGDTSAPQTPPTPAPITDLSKVEARLAAIENALIALAAVASKPPTFPDYAGTFGIRLKPVK